MVVEVAPVMAARLLGRARSTRSTAVSTSPAMRGSAHASLQDAHLSPRHPGSVQTSRSVPTPPSNATVCSANSTSTTTPAAPSIAAAASGIIAGIVISSSTNSPSGTSSSSDSDKVLCVCGVTHDDGRPMVECIKCNAWSHLQCVKLTQRTAKSAKFLCHKCKDHHQRKQQHRNIAKLVRQGLRCRINNLQILFLLHLNTEYPQLPTATQLRNAQHH